ncbi:MAG: SRPBCC family protein [Alphaproteobacteria bacterium]
MRWFFGLVLVIALITGVLYGVGRFLLPNSLEVRREATIERPRAAVFAMANDLKIVKEWSPFYALDPDADYTFSGDGPGSGQSMHWRSNVRQVGDGQMTIVRSLENQEIDSIIELNQRATLNTSMQLHPVPQGTHVIWAVTAECSEGWINVPCRYMNLVLRNMVLKYLDSGLARLKTLAEQLPNVDFEDLQPEFETADPQTYVYSPVTTSATDPEKLDEALTLGDQQVTEFMARYQLAKSGPQIRVTTAWDPGQGQISFRVGYPFNGPTPSSVVGVQIGQTPSGSVMHVTHHGPRDRTRDTYAKIYAYLQAHRISMREGGLPWEVLQNADPGNTQIDIFVPLQ